ncbi:alpha/beta fold hydrolase [Hymenobacter busanensis]|uniref:Alpha/beta fold hydrolase n=1 Tax=Hymenobacter busanensis TaxID=2607656 RepID=A0A7L4ZYU8_9BACT|nr:alpha/beta hydrolase [Hymenobacter busanensis]KAA9331515.1 alpha/beta fold hydrolase [Hymenobacter busanensis]QHJ08669.1 alpha/beta fold hydrolase [Hymenobacter busanensis]
MKKLGFWFALLLGLGLISASAQATPALDGLWKGPLKVPGGQWEVIFRVVTLTGGSYYATLDVPMQKVTRMGVKVQAHGDTVIFVADEAASQFVGRISADGKHVEGTWQQPGLKAPMTLEYAAPQAAPGGKVRLTPPYREEEVNFTNIPVNLRMAGMFSVPPGKGPFPAVVLVSDAGPQDRDATVGDYRPMGALADFLTRRGIAVLRVDDRGVGQSGGTAGSATIPELVADVQAALNFLRTRPEADVSHLGVIGHGEGGNVALLAAAQPLPPSFVVALAAYGQPGSDIVVQQQANILRSLGTEPAQIEAAVKRHQAMLEIIRQTPDGPQAQAIVANMLRQTNTSIDQNTALASAGELTSARYRHFLTFDPAEKLAQVSCPVLLLNGTADMFVAPETNLAILAKGLKSNKNVIVKKLPGVNHLFQSDPGQWPLVNGQPRETFSPLAQEMIREWIVAQAKKQ